ncbi:pyridoxamine 5'-phosphate oxidase family protein [Methyloceanibacter sp. wino2]|uniref:pyridoxamine 5'-phosphate oxidase family protein n=1 Tax=Methyloceanibacter sp. wino2 TaxID=2170729 RepID=UPI000D3E16ED|nr:pyridoxamine 5'-phosphate oxidase family protein [Methyloceanibacter sp. wino2]
MSNDEHNIENRVWEVVGNANICMLVTNAIDGPRARPMEARPDTKDAAIWFLTDRRGLKDDEVKAHPHVCLCFIHSAEKAYLSLTGKATVEHDPERARSLWNKKQEAWWSGPDDPNLLVMRVDLDRAEMWDGPASSAQAAFEFAKARVTGEKPDLGENRKTTAEFD